MTRDKLRDYCLSTDHDIGQHKARIWRSVAGFHRGNVSRMQEAIRAAAPTAEVLGWKLNNDGSASWRTRMAIQGANGSRVWIQARWRTTVPGNAPRLTSTWPETD